MKGLDRALIYALALCLVCSLLLAGCAPLTPAVPPTLVPPTETSSPPPTATKLALSEATPTPGPAERIDRLFTYLTQKDSFTGAVLAAQNGTIILSKGYGLADREKNVPNTPQTRYRIGSITKQFTAMGILILQSQGKLDVQDPICRYLSDCPAAWQKITIHHLLTHTSGIPSFTDLPEYQTWKASPSTPLQTIAHFQDLPLGFEPGTSWSYSNSGYILLGHIIEQASGQTYEAFLQRTIFDPLQMKNSGYDHNDGSLAIGYTGYYSQWEKAEEIDMTVPFAAGGLYSTVEDLYLWDQALYTETLLPRDLMALLFQPHASIPASSLSYGYGWILGEKYGRPTISHGGGIEGFVTYILRLPEEKGTIIVLSNRDTTAPETYGDQIGQILFGE